MRIAVITGLNGSGKTTALRALEDEGFYAVDNLPISLMESLIDVFQSATGEVQKVALVVDARSILADAPGTGDLADAPAFLKAAQNAGHQVELLFLDASDDVLELRFRETRRRHPLSKDGTVQEGIALERGMLRVLRGMATYKLDTGNLSVHELKRETKRLFGTERKGSGQLSVRAMSFGFKRGVPSEADLVFDVRFLPNPYFVTHLRAKSGLDPDVAAYVLERSEAQEFLIKLKDMLDFLLPHYIAEGKAYLTVAIGCTGGRHRSVALTEHVAQWMREAGYPVQSGHRDLELDPRPA